MNPRRCLTLAQRIDALLQRELGEGIDAARMAVDARYARDALFVCDALPGTDGALLAAQFRVAAAGAPPPLGEAPRSDAKRTTPRPPSR